jgi:AraC-like DNA-binding protein
MNKSLFADVKYLAINDKDEAWGLSVTTAGFQSILPHALYPPKGHPSQYWFNPASGRTLHEYQIVYVTDGEGVFRSDLVKAAPLTAGNLILLFPGEWHSYHPKPDKGWNTYWIGFYGNFPDNLIKNYFFTKKEPILDIGFNEQVVDLFNQAIELAKQEKAGFQQALSGITLHLLGMIYYIIKNTLFEDKEIITKIEQARMIMREHPGGEVCLKDIATSVNMSYSWFRKMFRQYTGLSPAQYQLQVKIQKAKALLVSSRKSVKEIAYLLDFESPNYFASFFKEKTGYTPLAFRKISHGKS